ncbi:uncharacterized protein LOC118429629 [Branchiostoma floridae]|uniref:Uncharacterized protein LOC118429629 n=1 Tax=Branchiostoma floridae TaxID=7739 RepID=A0A9J7M8E7_BRAFL|nr:uncharacterized protein LOC118429629 [Branchiostoma floridae]
MDQSGARDERARRVDSMEPRLDMHVRKGGRQDKKTRVELSNVTTGTRVLASSCSCHALTMPNKTGRDPAIPYTGTPTAARDAAGDLPQEAGGSSRITGRSGRGRR